MQQGNYKIQITNPCDKDWNEMLPDREGRFCDACAKSVIDFTSKTDEQIKSFFVENQDKKICGRFRKQQVERIRIEIDHTILYSAIPFWQKFLVVVLVAFGPDFLGVDFCFSQVQEDSLAVKTEQIDTLNVTLPDTIKGIDTAITSTGFFPDTLYVPFIKPWDIVTLSGSVSMIPLSVPIFEGFLGVISMPPFTEEPIIEQVCVTDKIEVSDSDKDKPATTVFLIDGKGKKPFRKESSSKLQQPAIIESRKRRKRKKK